jgi:N utilization substance protein B
MQALYQGQIGGHELDELREQYAAVPEYELCETEYFDSLLMQTHEFREQLDADIAEFGDIEAAQLDPVEHAVLWIALAEMHFHDDVHAAVIINEAVELTKQFGAEGGHRYINGLLDKAGQKLRPAA